MLVGQHMVLEHDQKGTVRLYNTYDQSPAAEIARECTANGGGRVKLSSGCEMRAMGFIPQEMWLYDPWLLMARKAQRAGDKGEYTKWVRKFFEVHKEYTPVIPKKYY